ncbi:MAG: MarR family winged helix-turn-helix transcriptional regulator [Novosphingobium sp.]
MPQDNVLELLATVSNLFERKLRDMALEIAPDLLFSQAKAIGFLGRNPGCSQQSFAGALERDKGQVARLVKELEARGLVRREADPHDWRAQCLYLTDAGQAIFERLNAGRSAIGNTMLEALPDARLAELGSALRAMLDALDMPD